MLSCLWGEEQEKVEVDWCANQNVTKGSAERNLCHQFIWIKNWWQVMEQVMVTGAGRLQEDTPREVNTHREHILYNHADKTQTMSRNILTFIILHAAFLILFWFLQLFISFAAHLSWCWRCVLGCWGLFVLTSQCRFTLSLSSAGSGSYSSTLLRPAANNKLI